MKDSKVVKFLLASVTEYSPFVSISGGVEAATFLVRLLQWSPVLHWSGNDSQWFDGEWFASTPEEINEATKLSLGEQAMARKMLQSRGLLVEEIRNNSSKLWFKVEVDKVIESLGEWLETDQAA